MKAHRIVDLLLEAPNRQGKIVYIFGPELPEEGYCATDLVSVMKQMQGWGIVPKEQAKGSQQITQLVKRGYTFLIKRAPGDVEVIGKVPVETTDDGKERAFIYLGLQNHAAVAHRANWNTPIKRLDVESVIVGLSDEELDPYQGTKPGGAASAGAPAGAAPTGAPGATPATPAGAPTGTAGAAQPGKPTAAPASKQAKQAGQVGASLKKEGYPPTGTGYSGDMMPINAPVEIGLTFDLSSKEGIIASEVHPGGPAAQAGLQAGDIIVQTGKFVTMNGDQLGPFYVHTLKHLEYVLRKADPSYPIPFRIVRGDQEHWLPIQPTAKKEQRGPSDVQKMTGSQPVKHKHFDMPNEPTPASETGNPSSSV